MSLGSGWIFFGKYKPPRTVTGSKSFLEAVVIFQTVVRVRRDADVITINRPGFEDVKVIWLCVLHDIQGVMVDERGTNKKRKRRVLKHFLFLWLRE